ncbi:MAG: DEAD/DEAH box helicase [Clostridia bacterium]|nr:DEAD/DEAH box helicase [Clostridia bacterium]
MQLTYGDIILDEAERSSYFHEIYNKLTFQFGCSIFNIKNETIALTTEEIRDLLKFANVFSKSNVTKKISYHRNLSQEIVSMLDKIKLNYDESTQEEINCYAKIVHNSVSNYIASEKDPNSSLVVNDFYYNIASDIKKQLNRIPNTNGLYFFDDQKLAIDSMQDNQYYSFSAPTSMGKTFIIKNFIKLNLLQETSHNKNIAIILPTKALINEVEEDLLNELESFIKSNNYMIISIPAQLQLFRDKNKILLFTPERMLQSLNEELIDKLDILFIDEAQKIYEGDDRAPLYYKLISIFNKKYPLLKIFFSSPYAENPEELLKLIDVSYLQNKKELSCSNKFEFSPVVQKQFTIDVNTGKCSIYNKLDNKFVELGINKKEWQKYLHEQLQNGPTIVYSKSKGDVISYANKFAQYIEDVHDDNDKAIEDFINFIKSEIHESYYLIPLLRKRIAFHMGIMPSEIRKTIEKLVKDGIIKIVFCTSTLLEGVNLPAVNIFVLSHKKSTNIMKPLDFKNLIGRAGRIKYSLWGNCFLLNLTDPNSIDYYEDFLTKIPDKESLNPYVENRKTTLVPSLFNNNFQLIKSRGETYSKLQNFVMYRNLVLESIINNAEDSFIYKAYQNDIQKYIDAGKVPITTNLKDISDLIFTPETIENVKNFIMNDAIKLPQLYEIPKEFSENERVKREIFNQNRIAILDFLIQLFTAFNWETFESKDGIGNRGSLSYYAGLITSWVMGRRLSQIIYTELDHHSRTGEIWNNIERRTESYIGSKEQKNRIINNILEDIEQIIKYSISNYVKKFIKLYEQIKSISLGINILDYLEYGTMDATMITLQKMGISRELAHELINQQMLVYDDSILKIKDIDKLKDKKKFTFEIEQIKINLNFILQLEN